ncbi:MAG: methyltransferase domain-containing protein [Silicimonas sp.]
MEYTYVPPPVPTLKRWNLLKAAYPGQSLLRMLEYEKLSTVALRGRVLDMGGGDNARYIEHLPKDITLESANIDPGIKPTHLLEVGQPLPMADDTFDASICFNTLEHIYDSAAVVKELCRVLKPLGQLHVTVPFMFRIHGHPDDYTRATPSWWRETFARAGFGSLELMPLVWGRRSTISVVPGFHGPVPRLRMHNAMLLDVLTAKLLLKGDTISGRRGDSICGTSPGWYMIGTK